MPFIPVPDIIEVVLAYELSGVHMTNRFYLQPVGAGPYLPAVVQSAANVIGGNWAAEVMATEQSQDISLAYTEARDLTVVDGVKTVQAWTESGGEAKGSLPPGVAAVATWTTDFGGRNARGRSFIPGIPEEDVEPGGALAGTNREDLEVALTAFINAVNSDGVDPFTLMVVSRYDGTDNNGNPIPRVTGVAWPITGVIVRNFVHSQRRRNPRG